MLIALVVHPPNERTDSSSVGRNQLRPYGILFTWWMHHLAGLPGTGKSALAQRLAGALSAIVLDKDAVGAALFPQQEIEYSTNEAAALLE